MNWDDHPLHGTAMVATLLLLQVTAACSRETPEARATAVPAVLPAAEPAAAGNPAPAAAPPKSRHVVVNDQAIPDQQLAELENHFRLQIVDGRYWYDRVSGAAGPVGGPTLAFILPGLELGGPWSPDASAGNTGVYINGRELPQYDLIALTRLVGFVQPGRYFLDATGNAGFEGGPPIINLVAASRQLQGQGSGDGWYSSTVGAGGNASGGAGYVMGKDGSGNSWISSY